LTMTGALVVEMQIEQPLQLRPSEEQRVIFNVSNRQGQS
jgi:hypothetical protein